MGLTGASPCERVSSGHWLPSDCSAGPNPCAHSHRDFFKDSICLPKAKLGGGGVAGGSLPLLVLHTAPLFRTGKQHVAGLSTLASPFLPTTPTHPKESCKGADLTQRLLGFILQHVPVSYSCGFQAHIITYQTA